MADSDPPDPFAPLFDVPRRSQPPPELLAQFLPKPVEPLTPEKHQQIAEYLSRTTPPQTAPEKSLLQKISDHLAAGLRLIKEDKLTKASGLQWVARLRVLVQPLFGGTSAYTRELAAVQKRSSADGIGLDEFSKIVSAGESWCEALVSTAAAASGAALSHPCSPPATNNVFVIHGHDELNARRLSDLLRESGLNPIVMRSQPGMSRALTDKFEAEAAKCSFAFAVFTADDRIVSGSHEYRQARPNVIYETGWFIGRLGKERVVLLLQSGAEMHTDLQGVSRVQFKDDVLHAAHEIHRELRAVHLIT